MEVAEYSRRALALESNTPVRPPKSVLYHLLEEMISLGHRFDLLKRHCFYGPKAFKGDLANAVETPPIEIELPDDIYDIRKLHAILGLVTEAGEACENLINALEQGTDLNAKNFTEELGDSQWYVNLGADANGQSLENILSTNIDKLETRYAEKKFSTENAVNRDIPAEQAALGGDNAVGASQQS